MLYFILGFLSAEMLPLLEAFIALIAQFISMIQGFIAIVVTKQRAKMASINEEAGISKSSTRTIGFVVDDDDDENDEEDE